ncbi:hypothetical protein EDB85DRAFT_2278845 [Lactarius pseudohatsudake]|nr:hypothetical protein EDB85DRAFT_2278845 [Lactarius pseudohatsudake]
MSRQVVPRRIRYPWNASERTPPSRAGRTCRYCTEAQPTSAILSRHLRIREYSDPRILRDDECPTPVTSTVIHRDRVSASSDIPKKEGAKNITLSCPYKMGVPEQHSSSVNFTLIVQWRAKAACACGEHRHTETAPAPLHDMMGWLALACPLRRGAAKGKAPPLPANEVACPLPACTGRRGRGKGRGGATLVPPCTGRRALVHPPFHASGEGVGPGMANPRVPRADGVVRPRGKGGAGVANLAAVRAERGGAGAGVERWGGLPSHAPCPRERGCADKREGAGPTRSAPVCPPSTRMGKGGGRVPSRAASPRVQGGAAKWEGEGPGQRALVCPLPHEWGAADRGKGGRRWHPLVRHPSAQTWRRGWGRREGPGGRGAAGIVCPLSACEGGGGQCGGRRESGVGLPLLFDANEVGEGGGRRGGSRVHTLARHPNFPPIPPHRPIACHPIRAESGVQRA